MLQTSTVAGFKFTAFIPTHTIAQAKAALTFKAALIQRFGGCTELSGQGYWNPPSGVSLPEQCSVFIVMINESKTQDRLDFHSLVEAYTLDAEEIVVLYTVGDRDIFYIHNDKES